MQKVYEEMVANGSYINDGCIADDRFNFAKIDFFLNLSSELKSSVTKLNFTGNRSLCFCTNEESNRFNENLIKVIKLCPNLTDLELSDFILTDDHFIDLGSETLEKLERLCLHENSFLTKKTFGCVAKTCRELKSFSFANKFSNQEHDVYVDVGQDDLISLISGNKCLTELHLMVDQISLPCLFELAECERLNSLSLDVTEWCNSKIISKMLASSKIWFFSFYLFGELMVGFSREDCVKNRNRCVQYSSLYMKSYEADPLQFVDLISVLKSHLGHVDTLHLQNFPTMTDDVLVSILENGSHLGTIRFVSCNTNYSTQRGIQNLIDYCYLLKFLFLDGYGQGGSVTRGKSVGRDVFYVVNRDYKEDVIEDVFESLSQYNKDFLSSETLLEVEMEVRRLEVARLAKLAGDQIDTNGIIGAKREREEE
jgi:hypothetical protein